MAWKCFRHCLLDLTDDKSMLLQVMAWFRQATMLNQCWDPVKPLGPQHSNIWIKINQFSFIKMHLKKTSANWRLSQKYIRMNWPAVYISGTPMSQWINCLSIYSRWLARWLMLSSDRIITINSPRQGLDKFKVVGVLLTSNALFCMECFALWL